MKYFLLLLTLFLSLGVCAQKSDFESVNFKKADCIADIYKHVNLANLPLLAHRLTFRLDSEIEKFRAIYTWVCSNIENDYNLYSKYSGKRRKLENDSLAFLNWNKNFKNTIYKTLEKEQKTICTGYVYLINELSFFAGLNCKIINGYGRTSSISFEELKVPNHAWNAVQINNKWYLCDATWSSGFFNLDENKFIKNYNDGYFLSTPELFAKNHYPVYKKWFLLHEKPTAKMFINAPIIYGNAFKYEITPIAPNVLKTVVSVNEKVFFKFKISNKNLLDQLTIKVNRNKPAKVNELNGYSYNSGILEFSYSFDKKGLFDVHLLVLNDVIGSYAIKVEKDKN